MENTILIAQAVSLSFMGAWLTIGAFENILRPALNETYTSEVLDMTRIRRDYPDAYDVVAHRRVVSPGNRRLLFRLIVAWELIAVVSLWFGVAMLALATTGAVGPSTAKAFALGGALMFTSVWTGFLVAGNWWCYWFGHESGQNTHFHMTSWGMANMIFIAAA